MAHKAQQEVILVCGPTASGKTEFAHNIALHNHGEIINIDSMQLYKQLPIITASPAEELKHDLPYHLYNFQNIDESLSAIQYLQLVAQTVRNINAKNTLPIIVGGSGMYINMLIDGYSAIPDIDYNLRSEIRNLHKQIGQDAFFKKLIDLDKDIITAINAGDAQRAMRAYEVMMQTGQSITSFQTKDNIYLLPEFNFKIIYILPERDFLYESCNKRFVQLIQNGAIDEVKSIHTNYTELNITAMKTLGVPEIISYLNSSMSFDEMIESASMHTRRYAKRQVTWFSNQLTRHKKQIIQFKDRMEFDRASDSFKQNNPLNFI